MIIKESPVHFLMGLSLSKQKISKIGHLKNLFDIFF